MPKFIYKKLDFPPPSIVIPYWVAYYLSLLIDLVVWLLSPVVTLHPTFTFFRFSNACAHRYFNIDKAKKHLGYKPIISLEDGMNETLKSFEHRRNKKKAK